MILKDDIGIPEMGINGQVDGDGSAVKLFAKESIDSPPNKKKVIKLFKK